MLSMKIFVRPVDHSSERQKLLNILQVNLPFLPHAQRFKWLYCANPDGPARSWFACQETSDQIVGVVSVFPRSMWFGAQLKVCGQVGDFATAASHRSLGPSLMMQRATFEPVNDGTWSFCYDCPPHDAGMSTFRRLGMKANCEMWRYALLLRIDRKLQRHLGRSGAVPTAVGNLILGLYLSQRKKVNSLEITEHTGPFGEEFSRLDSAVKEAGAIRAARSAAHLNWRYREDPLQHFKVLTARQKGELIAYIVFCVVDETATIVDLFGKELPVAAVALISAVVEQCKLSCQGIQTFVSEASELVGPFLTLRFRRRSVAARVVAYAKPGTDAAAFLNGGARMVFTQAELRV